MPSITRELENINSILKSNYVFLHLPRSAGSAIKHNIKSSTYRDEFRLKHHGYNSSMLNYVDKRKVKFCTIRNPYSWYLSVYNSKMMDPPRNLAHLKYYNKMENNSFSDFFDDVIRRKNGISRFKRWYNPFDPYYMDIYHCGNNHIGWYTANLSWYGQKDIECNNLVSLSAYNFRKQLGIDYILKVEKLQKDFNEMVQGTGIVIDLTPKTNTLTKNTKTITSTEAISHAYTDKMIEYIQHADSFIFDIFNYKKTPEQLK